MGYMGDELLTLGLSAGGGVKKATGLAYSVKIRVKRWLGRARHNIIQMMHRIATHWSGPEGTLGWKRRSQRRHRINMLRGTTRYI